MCGIAGRFDPGALACDPDWGARADALLGHRGPDGRGRFADAHCELVHRRLAIVDLSPAGRQPMGNEDGSVQIVFNGEIYNHQALRRDLEASGHLFRSHSDTEVLVHLYEDLQEEMVERLRGIFAFAVYDRRQGMVLLARDRFGVKPLYYARHGGEWIFASEIKAILARTGFVPKLDRQSCYDFLSLSYIPEPATAFANIRALSPGNTLLIGAGGSRHRRFYVVVPRPAPERELDPTAADAAGLLTDAVARQSIADVPVAGLLSGGIDSSLVVAASCRSGGEDVRTFSVRFPDRQHDETSAALRVAAHCRTQHEVVDLRDLAIAPESILSLLRHFDQPFADPSLVPMYWVSRAVRERGLVCVLSGDGGDEGFGGYPGFWRLNALAQLARLPSWSRQLAASAGDRLASVTQDWGRRIQRAAHLVRMGEEGTGALMAGLASYLGEEQKQALVEPEARADLQTVARLFPTVAVPDERNLEELSRCLTATIFELGLPSHMLRKVDMMSMLAGVEVRVPMLDEDFAELGLGIPHSLKTDGRSGKLVLRTLARQWLPRDVVDRPKHGFDIPLDRMTPPSFHRMVEELLLSPDARTGSFMNPVLVRQWITLFRDAARGVHRGKISRGGLYRRILIVLCLELWLREHHLSW